MARQSASTLFSTVAIFAILLWFVIEPDAKVLRVATAETLESDSSSDFESALEKISPAARNAYRDEVRTYIQMVKGRIGVVDVEGLKSGDLTSLITLLESHSELTGAAPGLELDFLRFIRNSDRHTVSYRQWIGGAPIDRVSSVDFLSDGTVTRLRSLIVEPSIDLIPPNVQKQEAIGHAINALSIEMGYHVDDILVTRDDGIVENYQPPTLYYRLAAENQPPVPYWRVSMRSHSRGLIRTAKVDALSGEVEILNSIVR